MPMNNKMSRMLVLGMLALGACAPKAVPTPDAMMGEGPTVDAMTMHETPTPDAMTMHETPTPAAMMMHETPSGEAMAAPPEPSMTMADWLATPLTDAATGTAFQVDAYHGKVVLVETMAVWCTTCRAQQEQMKSLDSQMMDRTSDLVLVSLDIDPNEDINILKKYVDSTGFTWTFAAAPSDLIRTIGMSYGDQFLNPPSTPILILDRQGVAHPLPFGVKSAQDLKDAVQPFLEAGG